MARSPDCFRWRRFGSTRRLSWSGTDSERAESQSFWNDFLDVFGIARKRQGVLFERRARRASTGKQGFIDVFWPGLMLAEQKLGGKFVTPEDGGVSNAEEQAYDYLNGGDITQSEFPRYVITSDFHTIQVTNLEVPRGDVGRTITFPTAALPDHVEDLAKASSTSRLDRPRASISLTSASSSSLFAVQEPIRVERNGSAAADLWHRHVDEPLRGP
jgi:hypothetical protein